MLGKVRQLLKRRKKKKGKTRQAGLIRGREGRATSGHKKQGSGFCDQARKRGGKRTVIAA